MQNRTETVRGRYVERKVGRTSESGEPQPCFDLPYWGDEPGILRWWRSVTRHATSHPS